MSLPLLPFLHCIAGTVYVLLAGYMIVERRRFPATGAAAIALLSLAAVSVGLLFMQYTGAPLATAPFFFGLSAAGLVGALACFWWFAAAFTEKRKLMATLWFRALVWLPAFVLAIAGLLGLFTQGVESSPWGWRPVWSGSLWMYAFFLYYAFAPATVLVWMFNERRLTRSSLRRGQITVIARGLALSAILAFLLQALESSGLSALPPFYDLVSLVAAASIVYAASRYSSRDISASYAAEDIIATMAEALVILDMSGHVVSINRAAEALLGTAETELKGTSLSALVTEADFRNKLVTQAAAGKRLVGYAVDMVRRSGKTSPAELSTASLLDREGNLTGIICIFRDVTDLKRAQAKLHDRAKELETKVVALEQSQAEAKRAFAELKQVEQRLETEHRKVGTIISNLMDPVILIDPDGKIALFNPAAKDTFGFTDDDIGAHIELRDNYSFKNFVSLVKRPYTAKTWRELNAGNPNEEEVTVTGKEQETTYKVTTVTIRDKRRYVGTMKVFYNLTREKMISKMKSEFITIAAHQMRTPLSAVKWAITMVTAGEAGAVTDEQKELLQKGEQANERIITLVNDMLNVSRLEEGRFDFAFAVTNFSLVLDTAVEHVYALAKQRKLQLTVDRPDTMPSFFFDRDKLSLAIGSILENAVKYTREGGSVNMAVSATKKAVKVTVTDTGIGIAAEDLGRLYEKFFRGKNVLHMQTEGSGLGLFVAKNIIERHGGTMDVASEENQGTVVTLSIPIKQPN